MSQPRRPAGSSAGGEFAPMIGGRKDPKAKKKAKQFEKKIVQTVADIKGHESGKGKLSPGGKLKRTRESADDGVIEPALLGKSKQGKVGEKIVENYLKKRGHADARTANVGGNNFPVDLVEDHHIYEVKTGASTVKRNARQWRVTKGEPIGDEKAWLKTASAAGKREHNENVKNYVMSRKKKAVRLISKGVGKKVRGSTYTVILNHRKRIANIYHFPGFHKRIGWDDSNVQRAFRGSFRY